MTPEQLIAFEDMKRELSVMREFMQQFYNAAQTDPQIQAVLREIVGATQLSLNDLTDVVISSPSNGQVLKYNGTNWAPGTDNT